MPSYHFNVDVLYNLNPKKFLIFNLRLHMSTMYISSASHTDWCSEYTVWLTPTELRKWSILNLRPQIHACVQTLICAQTHVHTRQNTNESMKVKWHYNKLHRTSEMFPTIKTGGNLKQISQITVTMETTCTHCDISSPIQIPYISPPHYSSSPLFHLYPFLFCTGTSIHCYK
jgi:hypothetical protein